MLFGMVDDIPSVSQIVKIEAGQFVSGTPSLSEKQKNFSVFPNPVMQGSNFTVELALPMEGDLRFDFTDASGKVVHSNLFSHQSSGNHRFNLSTTGLPKGIYFLVARSDGKIAGIQKLVLK